ncbi:MAG: hypothetical protein RL701_7725 [Pseudomonadota bacterium]|jgi:hypothetical protein
MTAGQLFFEQACSPSLALARGAALTKVLTQEQPIALYGTSFSGVSGEDAVVLGSYQLASQTLVHGSHGQVLRRNSGGTAVRAGEGIGYVALALHDRASMMSCPPGRLLNRNVRGVLQGLRLLGARANYFGRDFLSFGAQPAVFAAWDAGLDGSVLLEFFIAHTRSCFIPDTELAYPPRREPALRGQTPTTLAAVQVSATAAQCFEAIAEGHSKGFGVAWQRADLAALAPHQSELASSTDTSAERALHWSSPHEEAIGFVSAGVALDGSGKIAAVRVAGDFLAHRACAVTLDRVLIGVTPTPELVGRAVDAAFAPHANSGHDVEGIRNLRTFQDAIIDAADAAAKVSSVLS